MGGTFDPIHVAHLIAASEAMGAFQLDEVVFVPALPSHKPGRDITSAEKRLAMVELATASNPRFTTSRADIDREKPTYTIDTLTDLKQERGPDTDLFFITGADILPSIPRWSRSEELWELAHFVGVSRTGFELDPALLPPEHVSTLVIPALAMSSTEVRTRISEDRPVWYWLPSEVLGYIGKHGLYGAQWGYGGTHHHRNV